MAELTLTSAGVPLTAVQAKLAGGDPKAYGRMTAEHLYFMQAVQVAGPGTSWDDILANAQAKQNQLAQGLAGRPPGGVLADAVSNGLYVADAIGRVLTVGGTVTENPLAGVLGLGMTTAVGIGQDALRLSPVSDLISGQRSSFCDTDDIRPY
jgi:hypothetical protein